SPLALSLTPVGVRSGLDRRLTAVATCILSFFLAAATHAQYAPPPPPQPFAGFINEALRKNDPYMAAWDLGGALRLRYEDKEGFAVPGETGTMDFRDHGADVSNDYLLSRIRLHAGYTAKWF